MLFYIRSKKNFDASKTIKAGIFSFKNLNQGFLSINFSSNYRTPDTEITQEKLSEFIIEIEKIILEIYNPEVTFLEPADLKY